jgi:preprotein translocase subunit YajC
MTGTWRGQAGTLVCRNSRQLHNVSGSFSDERTPANMQLILAMQAGGGGMGWLSVAPLIFIFAIFYFLLILPQQRRQKKWTAMLDSLKTGDKVTTSGGLRGTIMALKDDSIHLRVPPNNLVMEVTKASVTQVTTAEEEAKNK